MSHSHFIYSGITSWGTFEERLTGIEILSFSSFDVKPSSALPIFTSIDPMLMMEASCKSTELPLIPELLGYSKFPKILYKIIRFM